MVPALKVFRSEHNMDRRTSIALLLLASGWSNSVVASPASAPALDMTFGGKDGYSHMGVTVNNEFFVVTPEEIAESLRRIKLERLER